MTPYTTNRGPLIVMIAWTALCWGGWGCGSRDGPKVGNVTGKVTLDGKPFAGALVTFMPEKGRSSTGRTNADGNYELRYTFERAGAEVGKHIVRITTAAASETKESALVQERLPAKYHRDTELKAEVKTGRNTLNFDLTSQPQGVPTTPGYRPARPRTY